MSYGLLAFTSRSHAGAQDTGLPRQDAVWIITDELVRSHKNGFDDTFFIFSIGAGPKKES